MYVIAPAVSGDDTPRRGLRLDSRLEFCLRRDLDLDLDLDQDQEHMCN